MDFDEPKKSPIRVDNQTTKKLKKDDSLDDLDDLF